jgi:hypothetical protein
MPGLCCAENLRRPFPTWGLGRLLGCPKLDRSCPVRFDLQRDQKDRVWGWADPGEEVTVTIEDQCKTAKAGPDSKWQVALDPPPTGGPYTLTVKGKNTLTLSDVLAGEVWICSGQSNIQRRNPQTKTP